MIDPRTHPAHFQAILADFADSNPLACQGLLSIAKVKFSTALPTLAVTLRDDPPVLLINPEFIATHVQSEDDVHALLLHEFLHVLLGHTRLFKRMDPVTNLALDAVINHIVQRELGIPCGAFFRRFYQPRTDNDPLWLLRPHAPGDIRPADPQAATCADQPYFQATPSRVFTKTWCLHQARRGLAEAKVLADDVLDLLEQLDLVIPLNIRFLGGHDPGVHPVHPANRLRLEEVFKQLDGDGIFRNPQDFGVGATPYAARWNADNPSRRWLKATLPILRRLLTPDPRRKPTSLTLIHHPLPIPTPGDRRAVLRSLWNPLIADFQWSSDHRQPTGTTNVYLDVSGSMRGELNLLTGLLWQLRSWIRSPFHAFSNGVCPATLKDGKLQTATTGGTCFNDVLAHIATHRPGKSLIITDGYIETPDPKLLTTLRTLNEEIHVLVSAAGSRQIFERHQIPASPLPPLPTPYHP